MANHKSALKRHRQSLVRQARNRAMKTRVKNTVRELREAINSGDREKAQIALRDAASVLAKAGRRTVIHANTASRRISRLTHAVNKMG